MAPPGAERREGVSAKPLERDMALGRIARALGCAGYSPEECDALMAWIQEARPASGRTPGHPCLACSQTGRRPPVPAASVTSGAELMDGLEEQSRFLIQGICLACRGRGFTT